MADGDCIIIGQANTASNPGNETSLSRNENTVKTVFVARNLNLGDGIYGESRFRNGVVGKGDYARGVSGISTQGWGVSGSSDTGTGVNGISDSATGVNGISTSGRGVSGSSDTGTGVRGTSTSATGVNGISTTGTGVVGVSTSGVGVRGLSTRGVGVVGVNMSGTDWGGIFNGGIQVMNGPIQVVNGNKTFKIDHPLDPQNKYLLHNAVEAPERKNVYDGVARLDEEGSAWVDLPEWFEALNGDFRYQLTAVGGAAPNLHVAEEISENRFKIAGGEEGMKVCWQVTGSRKDPWAAANPFEVEQEKPEEERGRYLDPSLYDAPEEQRVMIGAIAEAVEEEQRPPESSGIDFARLEEEHLRQIDELRRQEGEHRRQMEELRRRMEEREEEAPPEST
jgi:hypothetical protein